MAFPYVAWASWVESGSPRVYADNTIRFAKKDGGSWTVVEVANLGNGESYWFTLVQNYGARFLLTVADWYGDSETLVYRSEDGGDTWSEVTNNLADRIRWLDCWQGTWLAMLEGGQIASTSDGATWTVQAASVPTIDPDNLNPSCVCLGEDGVIHVVGSGTWNWNDASVYYTKSEDQGASWGAATQIMAVDSDYGFAVGGIGANEGHVCVVGCYGLWAEAEDFAIIQVSHDNGDTWESVQETSITRLADWGYSNTRGSTIIMDDLAVYAITSVEMSAPGQPASFDMSLGYVLHAATANYRAVGAPAVTEIAYGSYGLGAPLTSGEDGIICGTMAYGQSRSYAAGFRHYVPVDAGCAEATPYDSYADVREMRGYYVDFVDGISVRAEVIWQGDYPGPHCLPSSSSIRDESNQNDDSMIGGVRFSPWRAPSAPPPSNSAVVTTGTGAAARMWECYVRVEDAAEDVSAVFAGGVDLELYGCDVYGESGAGDGYGAEGAGAQVRIVDGHLDGSTAPHTGDVLTRGHWPMAAGEAAVSDGDGLVPIAVATQAELDALIEGHVILDDGTPMPQRAALDFVGFDVADDDYGDATVVAPGSSQRYADDDVSDPPTDAELDAAFGEPATVNAGFVAVLDDGGAGTDSYLVWTEGTAWFYAKGVKAL